MGGTVMKPQAQIILEQGELKKAKAIAQKLAEMGMDIEKIAQAVDYGADTVRQWLVSGMVVAK